MVNDRIKWANAIALAVALLLAVGILLEVTVLTKMQIEIYKGFNLQMPDITIFLTRNTPGWIYLLLSAAGTIALIVKEYYILSVERRLLINSISGAAAVVFFLFYLFVLMLPMLDTYLARTYPTG